MSVRRTAQSALASEVRAFATEQGLTVGQRGKFSTEVIEAFNKSRVKGQRTYNGKTPDHTRTVEVKANTGRTVKVVVNPSEVRAWARVQGLTANGKGRLSNETVTAFALAQHTATVGKRKVKAPVAPTA